MNKFKIDPPYSDQATAQTGYNTKATELEKQGYKMSTPTINNNTISGTGTRTVAGRKVTKKADSNNAFLESFNNKTDKALYEKTKSSANGPKGAPGTKEYADWKSNYAGFGPQKEEKDIDTKWEDSNNGNTVVNTKTTPTTPPVVTDPTDKPDKENDVLDVTTPGTDTLKKTKKTRNAKDFTTPPPEKNIKETPEMANSDAYNPGKNLLNLVNTSLVA
jgi:hypothetical protein